eukprot:1158852-Pelagomonas_calceolata.AAC.6
MPPASSPRIKLLPGATPSILCTPCSLGTRCRPKRFGRCTPKGTYFCPLLEPAGCGGSSSKSPLPLATPAAGDGSTDGAATEACAEVTMDDGMSLPSLCCVDPTPPPSLPPPASPPRLEPCLSLPLLLTSSSSSSEDPSYSTSPCPCANPSTSDSLPAGKVRSSTSSSTPSSCAPAACAKPLGLLEEGVGVIAASGTDKPAPLPAPVRRLPGLVVCCGTLPSSALRFCRPAWCSGNRASAWATTCMHAWMCVLACVRA